MVERRGRTTKTCQLFSIQNHFDQASVLARRTCSFPPRFVVQAEKFELASCCSWPGWWAPSNFSSLAKLFLKKPKRVINGNNPFHVADAIADASLVFLRTANFCCSSSNACSVSWSNERPKVILKKVWHGMEAIRP